jgi:protoporphyrinogen oxidase
LTAGYELLQHGLCPIILEQADMVGGLARTEVWQGYRFDIGGHRFYTKIPEITALWQDMLGSDFRQIARLSRIYYRSRFLHYPLNLLETLLHLGPKESIQIALSYGKARWQPLTPEETFEQWVINRFGRRLYQAFFKAYTEKVWGIPCSEIRAEWAAQRIQGLSLTTALTNAVFGRPGVKSLISTFHYPTLGPGMMWQRFQDVIIGHGGQVHLRTEALCLQHTAGHITRVVARQGEHLRSYCSDHVISSLPITHLVARLAPAPPAPVLAAARQLTYRALILVVLIVGREHVMDDNWLYIHHPEVRVGRIQNFKNWSAAMVPDGAKTSLGLEYFCSEGDDLWRYSDSALLCLAQRELVHLRLVTETEIEAGRVIRQPHAYPVYDSHYQRHLETLRDYLGQFANLQTIGRNGLHRYNNQDHSMLTGMLAARNIVGERHDVWQVNTERSYYEEFTVKNGQ